MKILRPAGAWIRGMQGSEEIAIFDQYLALSWKRHSYYGRRI